MKSLPIPNNATITSTTPKKVAMAPKGENKKGRFLKSITFPVISDQNIRAPVSRNGENSHDSLYRNASFKQLVSQHFYDHWQYSWQIYGALCTLIHYACYFGNDWPSNLFQQTPKPSPTKKLVLRPRRFQRVAYVKPPAYNVDITKIEWPDPFQEVPQNPYIDNVSPPKDPPAL